MASEFLGYANIVRILTAVGQQRATGELTLTNGKHSWRFYFFHGRLVYATGSLHRLRRYRRAIKLHCPSFNFDPCVTDEPWEYQAITYGVTHDQVTVDQAKAVIQSSLAEVSFAVISNSTLTSTWSADRKFSVSNNAALSLLMSTPKVEQVFAQAQQLWKEWQALGLGAISPHLSPVLTRSCQTASPTPAQVPLKLLSLLRGDHTLWDIATHVQKPVTSIARFLLPWVQRGVVGLKEIPDLPFPALQQPKLQASQARPLIACIDDSPLVGQVLAEILIPAGYRLLSVQDPLMGVAALAKHKPDLLFLDLAMPHTSGYNLCSFLRRTLPFETMPIIILTGSDGILDRTRAKLAGASDFLNKPPDPQVVLSLVQHHLNAKAPIPSLVGRKSAREPMDRLCNSAAS